MESRALEIIFGQVGHDFTLQVDEILFNGGRDHRTVIGPNQDLEYDEAEHEDDDEREFDPAEDGIGDLDGLIEQVGLPGRGGRLIITLREVKVAAIMQLLRKRRVLHRGAR